MIEISDEQRLYLELDGPPLPLIDGEQGRCYMLMPVKFVPGPHNQVVARVPGINATGEGQEAVEALATLAIVLERVVKRF